MEKVRVKEIETGIGAKIISLFERDFEKYTFVTLDSALLEQARLLLFRYGNDGLRTLDSLQLSAALILKSKADLFLTSDTLLKNLFEKEDLNTT